MSTVNEREMLRRALQLADGIEPRADGLQRIQARLCPPRPLAVAWAEAAWTFLRMRVPAALEAFVELIRSAASLAWERFGPSRGASAGRASRTLGWLRPAVALGVTVFIVAAGTYIAIDTQQGISPSASNAARSAGGGGGAGGSQGNGGGTNAQSRSTLGSRSSTGPKVKPTCRPAKPPAAAPSASGQGGQIPGASPTASPPDTSGASPSPTSTDSTTPAAGPTNTGQAGMSTAGTDVPVVGSSSPAVAALTSRSVVVHSSVKSSSLPICHKKRTAPHNSPGPSPAVYSYRKLDDGR